MDKRNIENILPLTSMQQAFLFASLGAIDSDPGLLQVCFRIQGRLDITMFREAWNRVSCRYAACRTAIHWQDLNKPLQVIYRTLALQWEEFDCTSSPARDHDHLLAEILAADRVKGLSLSQPPTMRISLVRLQDDCVHVCWTCHHILFDGWSCFIILRALCQSYRRITCNSAQENELTPSFGDYVKWSKSRELSDAKSFWRNQFDGFRPAPSPFERYCIPNNSPMHTCHRVECTLSQLQIDTITEFVRTNRLTLSTLAYGVWALVLGRLYRNNDVVFGVSVTGRDISFAGADELVGPLLNIVPVRAIVVPDQSVVSWLKDLLAQQLNRFDYDYLPFHSIVEIIDAPDHSGPLFDSLVVMQNPPWQSLSEELPHSLRITDLQGGMTSVYPVTIVIKSDIRLSVEIAYRDGFDPGFIRNLLAVIEALMSRLGSERDGTVKDLLNLPAWDYIDSLESCADVAPHSPLAGSVSDSDATNVQYTAPRNAVEKSLVALWESILHRHPIGIHDNFFANGGNSLSVTQLIERAPSIVGRKLPVSSVFQAPTVAELAMLITASDQIVGHKWVMPIRKGGGGQKKPLFFVNIGAKVVEYMSDPELPVYDIRGHWQDDTFDLGPAVNDIAAGYIAEIRDHQPHGPYFLVGYCIGGLVVFEMAQQLIASGEEIGLLVLLAPSRPGHIETPAESDRGVKGTPQQQQKQHSMNSRTVHTVVDYFHKLYLAGFDAFVEKIVRVSRMYAERMRIVYCCMLLRVGGSIPIPLRGKYAVQFYMKAVRNYRASRYPGRLIVFHTRDDTTDTDSVAQCAVWQRLATAGVESIALPTSNHEDVYADEACIEFWSRDLNERLNMIYQSHNNPKINA